MERNVVITLSIIVLLAFGMLYVAATRVTAPAPSLTAEEQAIATTTEGTPIEVRGPTSTIDIVP